MPKIILDKSFLQAESPRGDRLRFLVESGATLVLLDTFFYEFGTDRRYAAQWPAAQKKLFPFAESIEVWSHVSELLNNEIKTGQATLSPVNLNITDRIRTWFLRGNVFVPSDLEKRAEIARQEREVGTVDAAIADCEDFRNLSPAYAKQLNQGRPGTNEAIASLVNDQYLIAWQIKRNHGNPDDPELYIPAATKGLNSDWLAYQHAKGLLALRLSFMNQYGISGRPGKDFGHTVLDLDYIILSHYADAIATNETAGMLRKIFSWMHGDGRSMFSTSYIDSISPKTEDIQLAAYYHWLEQGGNHGNHLADWNFARRKIAASLWKSSSDYRKVL